MIACAALMLVGIVISLWLMWVDLGICYLFESYNTLAGVLDNIQGEFKLYGMLFIVLLLVLIVMQLIVGFKVVVRQNVKHNFRRWAALLFLMNLTVCIVGGMYLGEIPEMAENIAPGSMLWVWIWLGLIMKIAFWIVAVICDKADARKRAMGSRRL